MRERTIVRRHSRDLKDPEITVEGRVVQYRGDDRYYIQFSHNWRLGPDGPPYFPGPSFESCELAEKFVINYLDNFKEAAGTAEILSNPLY